MKSKKLVVSMFVGIILIGLGMGLASCKKGMTTIGILQVAKHDALDFSRQGFIDALKKGGYEEGVNVSFDMKNSLENAAIEETMAQGLVSRSDLLFGISTSSTQALIKALDDKGLEKPVLFSAVTDPVGSNIVTSINNHGGNVTGVSDMSPVEGAIDLFKEWSGIKKVAVLYTLSEPNSQYQKEIARARIIENGWEFVDKGISNVSLIDTTINTLPDDCDGIYIPTDNKVASAISSVAAAAEDKGLIVIVGDSSMMEKAGIASVGVDYYNIGRQAGEMAVEILNEEKTAGEIDVEFSESFPLCVNLDIAAKWNIVVPQSLIDKADVIIEETE